MPRITDLRQLRRYRHVVLSPHFDDAALSVGATIARLAAEDGPVLVITTCAGVPFSHVVQGTIARELSAQSHHPSVVDYVLARRDEDAAAMRVLGADLYWDFMLDAIYRRPEAYGDTLADLFGPPVRGDVLGPRALALALLVLQTAPKATLWGPLGVGHHVDHHLVARATLTAAERAPEHVRLYEEQPYTARPGQLGLRLGQLPNTLEPEVHDASRTLAKKLRAVAAYRSQVPGLYGSEAGMREALTAAASPKPYERVWRLGARPSIVTSQRMPRSSSSAV